MPIPLLAPVAVGAAEYVITACTGVLIAVGVMEAGKKSSVEDDDLNDGPVDASAVHTQTATKTEACESAEKQKTCKACLAIPVTSEKYRKVSRWSAIIINYQRFIAKTRYDPTAQMIQEFQCLKVTFDGWQPMYCRFLEAKARYDQFFDIAGKPKR
ncbi:Tox-REase-5 domain-containing protein [Photorhabdus asymbiotica]|uniref:Tox-REase-5 domain-containing protein n=1 Tax=Photorhabdus asymbiotica TaxID=291112 RepID=UPI003DA797E4